MLSQPEIMHRLGQVGAILDGHFVLTSHLHSGRYVSKEAVMPHVDQLHALCSDFARAFESSRVETVIAPAVAGVALSTWTAWELRRLFGTNTMSIWADKEGDEFVIKRGFPRFLNAARTLVVEDVITSGGSVARVIAAARACGADVIGVAAFVNRGSSTAASLGVPKLHALATIGDIPTWTADVCPLCRDGIAVNTDLGHGRQFLQERASASP
ncbi:MAG: hypothetical protein Q7S89_00175 [bacterium]|nr:hypothetical protein [bacterium]